MNKLGDYMKVKNKYDDYEERVSFEIVAHKCINATICAKPEAISNLLSKFYFTLYYIEDNISYQT